MEMNVRNPCVAMHSTRAMPLLTELVWLLGGSCSINMALLTELSQSLIPPKTALNVLLILPVPLVNGTDIMEFGFKAGDGIVGWHPSFVEAAIIHDLKALGTPAKERVRLLKPLWGGLAVGQELEVPTPPSLFPGQGLGRVRKGDSEPGSFQPPFHSTRPWVARFQSSIVPIG
jgi:hypothetical protein